MCLPIPFLGNDATSNIISRDALGCQWNDVKAPEGIRIKEILKYMLEVSKIMKKLGMFLSLSLSLIKISSLKQSQSRY